MFRQNAVLVCSGVSQREFLKYTPTNGDFRGLSMKKLLKTVENRLQILQPGSEGYFIKTQKGGTPMVKTLTTKTKGGYHYARFYGGAEGTAHLVPLDLG
jgi:hypothetical protein